MSYGEQMSGLRVGETTALIPRPEMTVQRVPEPPGALLLGASIRRPRNLLVFAAGVAAAVVGGAVLGLPLAAAGALGLGSSLYAALVARDLSDPEFGRRVFGPLGAPLRPRVRPDQLAAAELNAAYLGVLRAHEGVRTVLQASAGIVDGMRDVYGRCGDLVEAAGRVALSGDSLQRYLDSQAPLALVSEVARLDALAAAARDPHAAGAYRHAAQARRRQLDIYRQIEGLYDRVKARLAVVTSFLGAVEAMVVKLHALDLEQLHDDGVAISEQLDELRGEIDILETSLEQALVERP